MGSPYGAIRHLVTRRTMQPRKLELPTDTAGNVHQAVLERLRKDRLLLDKFLYGGLEVETMRSIVAVDASTSRRPLLLKLLTYGEMTKSDAVDAFDLAGIVDSKTKSLVVYEARRMVKEGGIYLLPEDEPRVAIVAAYVAQRAI
jgi:hypothetical protein